MPDLFIASDGKQVRSRTPVTQGDTATGAPNNPAVVQAVTSTPPDVNIQPPSDQTDPLSTGMHSQDLPDTSTFISGNDIERRNGILPLFSSFWQNPRTIYFDTQEPDEHILLFLRRHFITNFSWIFFTIALLILPPLAFYLIQLANYPVSFVPIRLMEIILILYYMLVLTNTFVNFLDWYYNISIITTKRVLDIHLQDLVSKKVSATKINLVQDVDFKQTGTIPSIFNYGDVVMQTAGKEINFIADAVPNPELVVQIVESLIGKTETPSTELGGEQ